VRALKIICEPGPGRRRQLEDGLRKWPVTARPEDGAPGCLAAVGPAVPLARASASLRWARRALSLAQRNPAGQAADAIVRCDEQLATLVLLADAELARVLSGQVLAPLRRLRPGQADRLAATLLAWLESAGDANAAARRLHVHPQTIRYRLRQVSELFGEALNDSDARFRLLLALRVRGLLGG
jgi:DNA-binding PucR family transcriptional regulator